MSCNKARYSGTIIKGSYRGLKFDFRFSTTIFSLTEKSLFSTEKSPFFVHSLSEHKAKKQPPSSLDSEAPRRASFAFSGSAQRMSSFATPDAFLWNGSATGKRTAPTVRTSHRVAPSRQGMLALSRIHAHFASIVAYSVYGLQAVQIHAITTWSL